LAWQVRFVPAVSRSSAVAIESLRLSYNTLNQVRFNAVVYQLKRNGPGGSGTHDLSQHSIVALSAVNGKKLARSNPARSTFFLLHTSQPRLATVHG